jgi:hypothetical protein
MLAKIADGYPISRIGELLPWNIDQAVVKGLVIS